VPPDSVEIRITRTVMTSAPGEAAPLRGSSPRTARAEQPPEVLASNHKPVVAAARRYQLATREELEKRLKLPCQNYQRPLRLIQNESRTI